MPLCHVFIYYQYSQYLKIETSQYTELLHYLSHISLSVFYDNLKQQPFTFFGISISKYGFNIKPWHTSLIFIGDSRHLTLTSCSLPRSTLIETEITLFQSFPCVWICVVQCILRFYIQDHHSNVSDSVLGEGIHREGIL